MTESPIIDIRNLTKRFGTFTAVDGISFSVRRGEIFGFLGAPPAPSSSIMSTTTKQGSQRWPP